MALCAAPTLHAQPVNLFLLEYELSNPGARSLGFGGAFAALADDATAAYANPAGLVQLVDPEVSLEVRSRSRSVPYLAGGRLDGAPTGRGIDTVAGPIEGRADDDTIELSFVSYVLPKKRWSLALYHHQLASFGIETESQGQFFDGFGDAAFRAPAGRDQIDLDLTATGGAFAWALNDAWSIGIGLVDIDGSARANSELYFDFLGDGLDSLFRRVDFAVEQPNGRFAGDIDDSAIAGRLGILWRPTERWSAGAFWRQGAELEGSVRQFFAFSDADGEPIDAAAPAILDVPDVIGAGLAYRALDGKLTVALEIDQIDIARAFRVLGDPADDEELFGEDDDTGRYHEAHLGAEYVLVGDHRLLALRAGYWYDERPSGFADLESRGTDHFAFGIGIAADKLKVDLAIDLSDVTDSLALSTIYSF